MAIKSDYISGTLTITQGSTLFTGTGTGWLSSGFKEGDTLIDITGATEYMGVVESITGEATGTLTKAWEGPTLTNVPYRMRYQPDGARSTAQARNLIEILGNGNITAFALLNGAANLLPMFTGAGAMTLVTRQALVSGAAYDVQVSNLAGRAAYDGQDQGYAVLVSNVGDGRAAIYSKNSATSGDWSDPAYVTGAVGPVVQIQAGTTNTLPTGQDATLVVRPITDGYALDFGIPRGLKGEDGADGPSGPQGEGLSIDATGDLSDRDAYDNEAEGFTFVDVVNGNLYFKVGSTPGVWSDPIPFGKGEKGDPGDSGATIVTTNGVGNGTVGPYTLNEAPASVSATWATISGVNQYDFTLSGNQITFGLIVQSGIPWQVKSSGVLSVVVPADGSIGASKINTAEAAGIRTAINAALKPTTAVAGNLAVFNSSREVVDTGVTKASTIQAQAGTDDVNYMTPLKTAQAILALSPPTDVSGLYSSVSALALSLADLQGSRLVMNGGVADAFDDESGINLSLSLNQVYNSTLDFYSPLINAGTLNIPLMTANTSGGVTVSANDTNTGAGFATYYAVDRNASTAWITNNGVTSGWFKIDFGSGNAKLIDQYTIQGRSGVPTQSFKDWIFEGSNNDSTWTTLDTRSSVTSWVEGQPMNFSPTLTGAYRYYRFSVSAPQAGGIAIGAGEIQLTTLGAVQNMTLVSISYPASAVPTQGRLVAQIDTPLTIVSGTDFDGAISRDGGTTWVTMPLTLTSTIGNIKTYESLSLVSFTGPTGSSLLFRIRTLTNKNIPISGVVMQWK